MNLCLSPAQFTTTDYKNKFYFPLQPIFSLFQEIFSQTRQPPPATEFYFCEMPRKSYSTTQVSSFLLRLYLKHACSCKCLYSFQLELVLGYCFAQYFLVLSHRKNIWRLDHPAVFLLLHRKQEREAKKLAKRRCQVFAYTCTRIKCKMLLSQALTLRMTLSLR